MNIQNLCIQPTLAGALLLGIPALSTAGTWVVVAAEQSSFQPGDLVDDSKSVTLADGTRLTLLAETGKTIRLSGSHSGIPGSEGAAASQKYADLKVIANLLQTDASLINTDSSEPRCLSDNSMVLWWANAANPEQVTVTDAQGKVINSLACRSVAVGGPKIRSLGWQELSDSARFSADRSANPQSVCPG